MSPYTKTILGILAMVALTAAAQSTEQLAIKLTAQKSKVRHGDPVMISVVITNQSNVPAETDQSSTAFDCFEVTDPDGHAIPYTGFDGQIMSKPLRVPPNSTAALGQPVDLTEKYLFLKPGRYTVRFRPGQIEHSGSPTILFEITPGEMSESDQLAASLLPVLPKDWRLVRDSHGEVAPFGKEKVSGSALHLCKSHMRGEAVYLWFTKAEAKNAAGEEPRVPVQDLGHAGKLYVYAAVDKNTPTLWTNSVEDISKALRVSKE